MPAIMQAFNAVSAKLAQCYVTIGSKRYNFMQMIDFEAKVEKTKKEVPILGQTGNGNKATGWKGTFKGTAHYNQSIMRKLLLEYKKTGVDTYFEIQVTNSDPTTKVGRQTIVLSGCNLDGGILAKFDADADYLDEDIEGTFEDWTMPETFAQMSGM